RAVELGVNHIGTAAFCFSRHSSADELISRALAPYPDDLVIATKVWPGRTPSGEWTWAAPGQLRGQVEENLRRLGRDHLDVVNLRVPPSHRTGSIAGHFAALAALRDAGLVRHLGLSNVTPAQLAEAPVVRVQNAFGAGAPAAQREFCGPAASRAWAARAGHPRHREPGPPGREHGGGRAAALRRGHGPPHPAGLTGTPFRAAPGVSAETTRVGANITRLRPGGAAPCRPATRSSICTSTPSTRCSTVPRG